MIPIRKYPRTRHLEGSRKQAGDEDLDGVPFAEVAGAPLVVEEKVDGANCGVSFGPDGALVLQSRGHALTGGARERHFALLKTWATAHRDALHAALGDRYVLYGEWLYARHTVFYDALPHYLLEFDVLDRETGAFLDTPSRRALLADTPVVPVPVLHTGPIRTLDALVALVRPSLYKSPGWRDALREAAATGENARFGQVDRAVAETDGSDLAEGLYVKVEQDGVVTGRYKWVRASFLDAVAASGSHWLDRPIVANRLAPGVDLFGADR
ncbi:MAG: RNA ligase family protein [Myxococcota bacterium]